MAVVIHPRYGHYFVVTMSSFQEMIRSEAGKDSPGLEATEVQIDGTSVVVLLKDGPPLQYLVLTTNVESVVQIVELPYRDDDPDSPDTTDDAEAEL